MKVLHAIGIFSDYTLCGDAFDLCAADNGGDSEGAPTPEFAAPGEVVTCKKCRAVIAYCRGIKRFRVPAATTPDAGEG